MKVLEIEIVNWDKFNPRKDLKMTTWFRLQNDIYNNPEMSYLTASELHVWIYMMALASRKMSKVVQLHVTHAVGCNRFNEQDIYSAVEKLQKFNIVRACDVDVTWTSRARNVDVTLQDEQDKTRRTRQDEQDSNTPSATMALPDGFSVRENVIEIETPKKNLSKTKPKEKLKKAIGPIDEFSGYVFSKLLINTPHETQKLWLESYPDTEWIKGEMVKMINWVTTNPEKAPKSRTERFISRWLSKGWDSHKRTIPLKKQSSLSAEDIEEAKRMGII